MFNAKVYKLSVISLSGIMEETFAAKESVRLWNVTHAERSGKLFLAVDTPETADVLVGVVGNRLEKTELIEASLKAGKNVLLFFSSYQDPKNTIASEQAAATEYMSQVQKRCFCGEFNSPSELAKLFEEQLNKIQ